MKLLETIQKEPKYSPALLLLALLFAPLLYIGCEFGSESTPEERPFTEGEWVEYRVGSPAVRVESPVKLTKRKVEVPELHLDMIRRIYSSEARTEGFRLLLQCYQYTEEVDSLSLLGSVDGLLSEQIKKREDRGWKTTTDYIEMEGVKGVEVRGSYFSGREPYRFTTKIFTADQRLWHVMVIYEANDSTKSRVAERIVRSMRIER